jgi:transposase
VTRTYAPCGQTPVLRAALTRDHLSVMGAVTATGRLVTHIQPQSCTGETAVAFLRQLLRQIPGKLLVVWDGASIHHGQAVKASLAGGGAARVHLERLPAYAPDLNPAEGVRSQLKRSELKNRCCLDLEELNWELGLAIRRLQRRPHLIRACFAQCGYG